MSGASAWDVREVEEQLSGDDSMKLARETAGAPRRVLPPRLAYDLIAPCYQEWRWFKFWRLNEAPLVRQWLASLPPGFGLDAGSGTGPYIPDIIRLGHRCVAVDLSRQMLHVGRRGTAGLPNASLVRYVQADVAALPFRAGQLDWVLCSRVLSHVADLAAVLAEFARVLTTNGECLITDVHPDHPYTEVAIPANGEKIAIETHKHPLSHFRKVVSEVSHLRLVSLDEYRLPELLWKPPRPEFEKLYAQPNSAVFYVSKLKKLAVP